MEYLKEYRLFKAWPSKSNIKDENEPFFNVPKYDYQRKKEIFGRDFTGDKNKKSIGINSNVIENILKNGTFSENVNFILQEVKRIANFVDSHVPDGGEGVFGDDNYLDSYLTMQDLSEDDIRELYKLGFKVKIYDDSNEFSEDFGDKYKVMWEWK